MSMRDRELRALRKDVNEWRRDFGKMIEPARTAHDRGIVLASAALVLTTIEARIAGIILDPDG